MTVIILFFVSCAFLALVEELISEGRLAGSVSGGRKDKAVFVPDIYTRSQNTWIDNFYKQNGYLGEYRAVPTQKKTEVNIHPKKGIKGLYMLTIVYYAVYTVSHLEFQKMKQFLVLIFSI